MTSTDDSISAGGSCTLREAVSSANADNANGNGCANGSGTDTIEIPAGRYVLTRTGTGNDVGALYLNSDMTLAGAGASKTILDGNSKMRVIEVANGKTDTIDGVTITNGRAPGAENAEIGTNTNTAPGGSVTGSTGIPGGFGGGISNFGKLTVNACVIQGNKAGSAGPGNNADAGNGATGATGGRGGDATGGSGGLGGFGGGIYSLDTLTVTNSTITENVAGNGGLGGAASGGNGGISTNGPGGDGGNGTGGAGGQGGGGGGIFAFGTLTVRDSVISSNRAGTGGASGAGTAGGGSNAAGGNNGGGYAGTSNGSGGGTGGLGGGILAANATVEDTTISQNLAGNGGAGSNDQGSPGGFGSGSGPGGPGGVTLGGNGGAGGSGGGIIGSDTLALSWDAVVGNRAGVGGVAGTGTIGADRPGHTASALGGGGTGGAGGNGGGLGTIAGATKTVTDSTFDSNATGNGARGANGIGPADQAAGGAGGAAGSGGAIDANGAPVTISRSTISSNVLGTTGAGGQGTGSGLNGSGGASGTASALRGSSGTSVAASIFDSNASSACTGTIADNLNDFRFPNSGACPGTGTSTQLGPLADNGGSTLTRALPSTSPAANLYSCTASDQRGVARPGGALCDAGAYEAAAPTVSDPGADAGFDSATLHVNVNPNAHATVLFDYGTTMGYGATAEPVIVDTRGKAQDASVTISGLAPLTTYHFRARATNSDGSATSQDATFTTAPPPAPVISHFSATPSTFAVAGKGSGSSALAAKDKPVPHGTNVKYDLTAAGTVRITFAKRVKVKRKHGHKHGRGRRKKIHYVNVGDLSLKGEEGPNSDPFSGRLDSKALKRGTYRMTAIASGIDGKKSKPATATIHIKSKRARHH